MKISKLKFVALFWCLLGSVFGYALLCAYLVDRFGMYGWTAGFLPVFIGISYGIYHVE